MYCTHWNREFTWNKIINNSFMKINLMGLSMTKTKSQWIELDLNFSMIVSYANWIHKYEIETSAGSDVHWKYCWIFLTVLATSVNIAYQSIWSIMQWKLLIFLLSYLLCYIALCSRVLSCIKISVSKQHFKKDFFFISNAVWQRINIIYSINKINVIRWKFSISFEYKLDDVLAEQRTFEICRFQFCNIVWHSFEHWKPI